MKIHPLLTMRPGNRFETRVLGSHQLTPTTHGIEVEKPADFTFKAVQFTFLQLDTPRGLEVRPMSLATSPTKGHLEYGVRMSDSAFKQAFAALQPNDKVVVQGPLGHYILDPNRPAVLIGGGIGITPLKGMAEYAFDCKLSIPIRLIYSNRTVEEIVYKKELDFLEHVNSNFKVIHTLTRLVEKDWPGRTGRINAELLAEVTEGLDDPVYYLCGATSFVEMCRQVLISWGVAEEDMRFEVFRGYHASA
jgi:ferredoxin-NADP reductase